MTTTTRRTAAEIARLLNAYEADHTDPSESNLWDDVIARLPEYDAETTAAIDPSGQSDRVALRSGQVVRWTPEQGRWV